MSKNSWNTEADYLYRSRKTNWNNDYVQFLIEKVWQISKPVNMVDFGCGTGFLGALFLPLLPQGSTYTGLDWAETLLAEAEKRFAGSPFRTTFVQTDLLDYQPVRKFDLAVCHTVLQHIPDAVRVMEKMRDSVVPGGKVICMEGDRNIANAALYFDGLDYEKLVNLGILQKLWLLDRKREGCDHNIGPKIPFYMQNLGLSDISVRMNDCVSLMNPQGEKPEYEKQVDAFVSGGWGAPDRNWAEVVRNLTERGLTAEEADYQVECEQTYNRYVRGNRDSARIISAHCQIITYGTV